jgi:hypothetical protein|tara:strand:- start:182 stop:325 length:144 start_codon:yes stop_codon:yes gene_type:complete
MKTILEGLKLCKENGIYDKNINIALGINKIPLTIQEGLEQIKMKNGK